MKHVLAAIALLALGTLPALANPPGGISGHVVREANNHAIADVPIFIYKMPVKEGDSPVSSMRTDKNGFFADVALPFGTYLVATRLGTQIVGCTVDAVYDGFMTHMKLAVGDRDSHCSGPRVRTALVNPALTADVYLITGAP